MLFRHFKILFSIGLCVCNCDLALGQNDQKTGFSQLEFDNKVSQSAKTNATPLNAKDQLIQILNNQEQLNNLKEPKSPIPETTKSPHPEGKKGKNSISQLD